MGCGPCPEAAFSEACSIASRLHAGSSLKGIEFKPRLVNRVTVTRAGQPDALAGDAVLVAAAYGRYGSSRPSPSQYRRVAAMSKMSSSLRRARTITLLELG